jgi:hypothetical protein
MSPELVSGHIRIILSKIRRKSAKRAFHQVDAIKNQWRKARPLPQALFLLTQAGL